jgi:transposase
MLNVGLDAHWKSSSVCILDENGSIVKEFTRRGGWDRTLMELAGIQEPFRVAFEASCGYGTLYDRLRRLTPQVQVAHPGHLSLIFKSKKKNDRIDAKRLAKLLYLDEVPRIHVPGKQVRMWRQMIEARRKFIDKRTRTKNGIRSLLRSYGVQQPRGLWTKKGRQWLRSVALPDAWPRTQLMLLQEELDDFDKKVKLVTRELDRIAEGNPAVALLRTIPGVGPRTAETIVAYVDDPERFGRINQAGAYFGLVPCQNSSGPVDRLGHITRQGPATARKYLVEATWQARRRDPHVRAYFDRICGGKKERRKLALVATAHHLLRCMVAMLKSGEVWRQAA